MPRVSIELPDGCRAYVSNNKLVIECSDYAELSKALSRIRGVNLLEAMLDELNGSERGRGENS